MDKTETKTVAVARMAVGHEAVHAKIADDGSAWLEITVGGPEGEWWGRSCTTGMLSRFSEALRIAAREPQSPARSVDCGDGYSILVRPRIVPQSTGLGLTEKRLVEISGYTPSLTDRNGKPCASAVLLLPAQAAESIGWGVLIGWGGV